MVTADVTPQLVQMTQYLLNVARYDADYDVRDRSRFFSGLLRGIKPAKPASHDDDAANGEQSAPEDTDEEEMAGVVLRREQIRVVLLGQRVVDDESRSASDYEVGTLSRQLGRRLAGYEPLPDWTDDPTDPSLREVERQKPEAPTFVASSSTGASRGQTANAFGSAAGPLSMPPGSAAVGGVPSPLPRNAALSTGSPFGSSPAGSVPRETKAKFKDLDAFLNSESEEDDDDEEDEDTDDSGDDRAETQRQPMAVSAPPRREIAPEYYDTSEEEDDDTEEEEDESSEEDVRAPLAGTR